MLLTLGREDEARAHGDELLSLWPERCPTSYWVADLGFALPALGREQVFLVAARHVQAPSRWLDAATAAAAGDHLTAAELYAAVGSLPDEALARAPHCPDDPRDGVREDGEAELARALAIFQRLGARAHARDAEALLALPG